MNVRTKSFICITKRIKCCFILILCIEFDGDDNDDNDDVLFLKNDLPLFQDFVFPHKMRVAEKHSENIFVKP